MNQSFYFMTWLTSQNINTKNTLNSKSLERLIEKGRKYCLLAF